MAVADEEAVAVAAAAIPGAWKDQYMSWRMVGRSSTHAICRVLVVVDVFKRSELESLACLRRGDVGAHAKIAVSGVVQMPGTPVLCILQPEEAITPRANMPEHGAVEERIVSHDGFRAAGVDFSVIILCNSGT